MFSPPLSTLPPTDQMLDQADQAAECVGESSHGCGSAQVQSQEPDKRTRRPLGILSRGGGAVCGPVSRNTTPSRSILQTVALTAPGRRLGEMKYRRPFVPTVNASVAWISASSELKLARGNFSQPSRYSADTDILAGTCLKHHARHESLCSLRLTRCVIFALSTTSPNLGVPMLYSPRRVPGAWKGAVRRSNRPSGFGRSRRHPRVAQLPGRVRRHRHEAARGHPRQLRRDRAGSGAAQEALRHPDSADTG